MYGWRKASGTLTDKKNANSLYSNWKHSTFVPWDVYLFLLGKISCFLLILGRNLNLADVSGTNEPNLLIF